MIQEMPNKTEKTVFTIIGKNAKPWLYTTFNTRETRHIGGIQAVQSL